MDATKQADRLGGFSKVKVSAFNTRNAVLAFAVIGIVLIILDTILHMTRLINRMPAIFDLIVSRIELTSIVHRILFFENPILVYYCYACFGCYISYSGVRLDFSEKY